MKPQTPRLLSKFVKFFFSNSVFLALNGALVFVFASLLYGVPISIPLLLASFLITLSVYSLNMATDSKEDMINRSQTGPKTPRHYLAVSLLGMVGSIIVGVLSGVYALLVLISPLVIGAVYSVKISKSLPRLKEVVGVKSLVVALSWGITGAFLPATQNLIPFNLVVLVFLYVFTQILVNTIIFDTLDIRGDRASGITTVPLALGLKRTKLMLHALNASFLLWLAYCLYSGIFIDYLVTLAVGVVFETFLIWYFFRSVRPRLHAELLVDGEWVYLVVLMRLLLH